MPFQLPELPYSYDALEPHIDSRTMEIHHTKHHQGYTNNLNAALEKHPELKDRRVEDLLGNLEGVPQDIRTAVRNNGGGYYNHLLFWQMMSPNGGGQPSQDLGNAITKKWNSFEGFSDEFRKKSAGQFGSGWGWLVVGADGALDIVSTPNQDNPISSGQTPLLGVDVWEHAYYLHYQNRRADYLDHFMNLVNWDFVADRYAQARR